MKSRLIFWSVFTIAVGFCALIFAPVIEGTVAGDGGLSAFSWLAFSRLCHQDPARSFWINGQSLPVCARCTGIYLGFFWGWAFWHLFPKPKRDRPIGNGTLIAGLAPLVLDGLGNALGLFSTPIFMRFFTGLIFGAVSARALWPALLEAAATLTRMVKEDHAGYEHGSGADANPALYKKASGERTWTGRPI